MIISTKKGTPKEELEKIVDRFEKQGLDVTLITGKDYNVFGLVGDTTKIDERDVLANPWIDNVTRVSAPYKRANRLFHPADSVIDCGGGKPGGKENNEPLRYFGEPHKFDFPPKHHVDLCTDLGFIDYTRGVKLAGSGFWMYTGLGARLEWALLNYFIDTHLADGYEFILPPHMLEYQCGETAGQFPKFADEVYKIQNPTDDRTHYMLPTAEAALASIYRDEILAEADLPKKFFAYTPCFRREAGSARAEERGMVRGHQFNKVEMFQFTRPEDSDDAFDELVTKAENLVKGLGFHFRTVKLAAGDCSASMARTYDIEIQIPSMQGYKEVSSVSNARDYQARRGNIRFRREATGKPEFLHTLNGSGLATSRIFPAMVEQNQLKDGSVKVPEVLQKYLGGLEVISKK